MKVNWVTELEMFRAGLHQSRLIASKNLLGVRAVTRALFLILILSSCQKEEPHLAFFDTAFCNRELSQIIPEQVTVMLVRQTDPEESICALPIEHAARHGDRVLIQFFKNLGPHTPHFKLSLYSLFSKEGVTSEIKWKDALADVNQKDVHLVASAIAYRGSLQVDQLPAFFLASGQWGGRVKKDDSFFPQELLKEKEEYRKKSLVFGSYHLDPLHQEAYDDQTLLYNDLIDYWFAATEGNILSGSSNALAIGAARAMSFCGEKIVDFGALKECLSKREVTITTIGKKRLRQF